MIPSGDKVFFEKETRVVTNTIKNINGQSVVLWKSKNTEGACMPCVWEEWRRGGKKAS